MRDDRLGDVWAADRLVVIRSVAKSVVLEREAEFAQRVDHGPRAAIAVGAVAMKPLGEAGIVMVDAVAEDVQVTPAGVDRGDLNRGDHANPKLGGGLHRLFDPVNRVVVSQREQLDAGRDGQRDDLARRQRAV